MIRRCFLLTVAFLAGLLPLLAQGELIVEAPAVVALNEPFKIVYSANEEIEDFKSPDFTGFDIMAGPTPFTSRQVSIINGKRTSSYQMSYTFILRGVKEGKFVITPAMAETKKNTITSRSVTIEVIKDKEADSQGAAASSSSSAEDCFLRLSLSKNRVVKGEPVVATVELYTKVPIVGINSYKFPSFNGFWSQEIESPQSIQFERKSYDGTIYDVALLKKYMLLPQQDGVIEIEPATMVAEVQVRSQGGGNSFFDDFFESYSTAKRRLSTSRQKVTVSPLPSNAPSSFKGGVGKFEMNVESSLDTLSLHEAASLRLIISGSGNVNLTDAPDVVFPQDFEVYDVKTEDRTNSSSGGTQGSKLFEYPFIPRVPGDYVIPPVEFSYYDIAGGKYRTLKTKEIRIHVKADPSIQQNAAGGVVSGVGKQSVKVLGEDIRYIKMSSAGLKNGHRFVVGSLFYWISVAAVAVLAAVLYFVLAAYRRRRGDAALTRTRKATKIAKARLKSASDLLGKKLYTAFYEELHRTLAGFIADKLLLNHSEMSKAEIESKLLEKGVEKEYIDKLMALLDACEFARYAPATSFEEMDKHYRDALELVSYLEDKI